MTYMVKWDWLEYRDRDNIAAPINYVRVPDWYGIKCTPS